MGLLARMHVCSAGKARMDKVENPEMVLQKTIRDMRDRVPIDNSFAGRRPNDFWQK